MALRSHITNLQLHIVRQLALNREVILRGILTPHVRLKLSEQRVRAKHSPVHRLPSFRIKDSIYAGKRVQAEGIGIREASALVQERLVKQGVERERTPTKGRLSAELLEHELLDGVVEHSPTCSNTCLTRSSWTPCDADARSKGLVIRLRQSVGHTGVSRHHQADRRHRRAIGVRCVLTGIDLAYFPRPKRLHVLADIGDRGVKLPAQPVVEGQIWFDLPAVLCEQIKPCAAYVLDLGRPLTIRTGKSKEIVGEGGVSSSCVGRGSVNKELAVHVKVQSLVKSLATNVAAKLQRVFPDNLTDSVRPLEGIAYLRQFALTVVSDRESAAHLNERKPLVCRTEIGMNAQRVLRSAIGEARHRTGNISEPCRSGRTGILNYRREGGMLKCPLRLTVEVEAELIDSTIADSPGMADVPLLKPFVDDGPKPRNV